MTTYKCISSTDALAQFDEQSQIVDIRDPQSFSQGRIRGAKLLNNENLDEFIAGADMDKPVFVCCYHGNSSKNAAQFLIEKGFDDAYSIDGGFVGWEQSHPDYIDR